MGGGEMSSTEVTRRALDELNGIRGCLFSAAKGRWGFALCCSYLAIVTVPTILCVIPSLPRWTGAVVAAFFAIAARLLHWWSDTVRSDAERLHRQNEYARGIGLAVEASTIATIKAKYSRLEKKWSARQRADAKYYESSGNPSPRLLALMMRESAWWTQQLAAKAANFTLVTATLSTAVSMFLLATVVPDLAGSSTPFTLYALAVCIIVSLDLFYLGFRYIVLSTSAEQAFSQLDALELESDEKSVIVAAGNYQLARQVGPLIPERLKRWHQRKLQRIWDQTLSRHGTSERQIG